MMNESDVVIDMKAMLEGGELAITNECCIYMVPHAVRKAKQDAYTPTYVSIGPYHHRTHPRLISMEKHKLILCKAFLKRKKTILETLIHYLEENEPVIRRCYSGTLKLSKKKFVKLILVDSCFILELFLRSTLNEDDSYGQKNKEYDDSFIVKPWLDTSIRKDLLLLENQLPFFVLEGLFNHSFSIPTSVNKNHFLELAFGYFSHFNMSKLVASDNITIRHFTDLMRIFHLPHPPQKLPEMKVGLLKPISVPSASQLRKAGLKFKVNTESKCSLDLKFSGRVLQISQLRVEDDTEILFRNMIALEQSLYPYESYITNYVVVMDLLINTGRDVDILVEHEVLGNCFGETDYVANMFNNLKNGTVITSFSSDYHTLCEDLNKFSRDPWRKSIATLRRDHCNTPWKTAGCIAAVILLILTIIQTVNSF